MNKSNYNSRIQSSLDIVASIGVKLVKNSPKIEVYSSDHILRDTFSKSRSSQATKFEGSRPTPTINVFYILGE
jgi:hypothetical protein